MADVAIQDLTPGLHECGDWLVRMDPGLFAANGTFGDAEPQWQMWQYKT